ncbi:hypothetical protein RMATCC62417_02246 [Rhizopus microsporus]|nr:hypothetical protein RMATCC62417_02246 [Rhizopus microsporus]
MERTSRSAANISVIPTTKAQRLRMNARSQPSNGNLSKRKVITKASTTVTSQPTAKRSSITSQTGHNVQVVLRLKGKYGIKQSLNPTVLLPVQEARDKKVILTTNNYVYSFDHIFYQDATQQKIYDQVGKPILSEVLCGYNCTIFAYGQTGTGKTYTMEGDLENANGKPAPNAGIIPRIICDLFECLNGRDGEHIVKISMLELYNEELRDLLYPGDENKTLNIYDDAQNGVKVSNIHEEVIISAAHGLDIVKTGVKKRMTAATNCNEKSSRSHCIFTINVTLQEKNDKGAKVYCTSKLHLVDLAGSENSKASGSEHLRAREAASINKSLLTLGRVINSLSDKAPHIPYRESKLTRLLKDSLGGRTKTSIITTIDPLSQSIEDMKNTLDYGSHAKNISNAPLRNGIALEERHVDTLVSTIIKMQDELRRAWDKNGYCMPKKEHDELVIRAETAEQIAEQRGEELKHEKERITEERRLFEEELRTLKQQGAEEIQRLSRKERESQEEIHRLSVELDSLRQQLLQKNKVLEDISHMATRASVKREREDDGYVEEARPQKKK